MKLDFHGSKIESIVKEKAEAKDGVALSLPLRPLLIANANPQQEGRNPLEDTGTIHIDRDNINEVMESLKIKLNFSVENCLSDKADKLDEMSVSLDLNKMKDFHPDSIAKSIPELKLMLTVRKLLSDLKYRLITNKEFKKELNIIIKDRERVNALKSQLDKYEELVNSESDIEISESELKEINSELKN